MLGLGDVYLGAPVATPVDPRHRLVTTKYNPARTWTPENAVGIGGAYMCIYGMEGPGGYQLFGRTIQMWNTWRATPEFSPGNPWLLRFFDQIRFFPVSRDELTEARAAFPHGAYPLRIEETQLLLRGLRQRASTRNADSHRRVQVDAAGGVRGRAAALEGTAGSTASSPTMRTHRRRRATTFPTGCIGVFAAVPGNVWKILVEEGDQVESGQTLAVIESMKMEISIAAHRARRGRDLLLIKPGQTVRAGDLVCALEEV